MNHCRGSVRPEFVFRRARLYQSGCFSDGEVKLNDLDDEGTRRPRSVNQVFFKASKSVNNISEYGACHG
jgi:hypothetical protein